jgi:hypothetical protein
MASSGTNRSGLLTAGGILSILGGACEIYSGGTMAAAFVNPGVSFNLWGFGLITFQPGMRSGDIMSWGDGILYVEYTWLILIGAVLLGLGIVAISGGISAARLRRFGLSLAGAICALPSVFLGIAAVVLVALGRKEFATKGGVVSEVLDQWAGQVLQSPAPAPAPLNSLNKAAEVHYYRRQHQ